MVLATFEYNDFYLSKSYLSDNNIFIGCEPGEISNDSLSCMPFFMPSAVSKILSNYDLESCVIEISSDTGLR